MLLPPRGPKKTAALSAGLSSVISAEPSLQEEITEASNSQEKRGSAA
jgi:vacuolar-type H+-ATPase subunit H